MDLDPPLRELAARQHGLLARRQVRELGGTTEFIRHRLDKGAWERVGRRVLRVAGSAESDAMHAMAAVLDAGPGAAVSHSSAAHWWGVTGLPLRPVHVSTRRRTELLTRPLGVPHRIEALSDHHITVLHGVPIVRPELVILQLCGSVHPERAARALDRMWTLRLLSGRSARRVLDEVSASGVRGVTVLRGLLDDRGDDYVPPATNLEARFAQVLREAGESPMVRQVDLGDTESWCGRVDFADPPSSSGVARARRALIEVDSEMFHTALLDVRADALRQRRLERAGFVVGRVSDVQVFHHRHEVVAEVRRVRAEAQRPG